MKRGKIIAVFLTMAIVMGMLSGCSSSQKADETSTGKASNKANSEASGQKEPTQAVTTAAVAMGRYVEENIPIPDTIDAVNEKIFQMVKNPEGKIELSCRDVNAKPGKDGLTYTLNEDNTWTKNYPQWLNQAGRPRWMSAFFAYAADGTRYAFSSYYDSKENKKEEYVLKSKDGMKSKKLKLDKQYTAQTQRIRALSDDRILLNGINNCIILKAGEQLTSFSHANSVCCAVYKNLLMLPDNTGGNVNIYNIDTGETVSEVPLPNPPGNMEMTADDAGNWYMVTDTGLYRLAADGKDWEQLLDGAMGTMSDPTVGIWDIAAGKDGDLYVEYEDQLKHYVYHKDIPSVPGKTLTITSLKNNTTVRKAIFEFMNANPDVKVEFNTMLKEGDTKTKADIIKDINTELLAGKGSDLYLLDGMPVDSYVEKGALADLSEIIDPMIKNGTLASNKLECYRKEGKLYYVPIRFGIEFAYGSKDTVALADNLASLSEYAKNHPDATGKRTLLGYGSYSYRKLLNLLYKNYFNNLKDESGTIKKDEMKALLEQMKIISEQSGITENSDIPAYYTDADINNGACWTYYDKFSELVFLELNNIQDIYQPLKVLDLTKGDWKRINDGAFIPYGILGMNNASVNKELAEKFIQECYIDTIQELNLGDGFPVNSKALGSIAEKKDNYQRIWPEFTVTQPSMETIKKIVNYAQAADIPVSVDETFLDLLENEITPYLKGEAELDSTTDAVIEKAKLYMTE